MTDSGSTTNDRSDQTKSEGRSFDFSFSFGKKALARSRAFEGLVEEASQEAAASSDGVGQASQPLASLEFSNGVLRVGGKEGKVFELDLHPDAEPNEYRDPFPALTALRIWIHRAILLIAAGLPIGFIVLGMTTHQTTETTFYMMLFGLLLSMMLVTSFMPQRSWLDRVMESLLADAVRKQKRTAQDAEVLQESLAPAQRELDSLLADAEADEPAFEIKCQSCGARFTPAPPRAVCPYCSTPALPD